PYPALRALELLPQQAVEDGRGHPAPGELAEERAELERALQRLEERVFLQGIGLARDLDGRLLHPLGEQELLHLALAHQLPLRLALLHLEERRLGDEEPAGLDDRHHVPEEEREQEGPDMRA